MAGEKEEPFGGLSVNPFSSIFGGDTGLTYEELKRRRAIAAALASRGRGFPKTLGEGLTYFGESLGEAIADWRLRQMEERSKAANAGLRAPAPEDTTPPTAPDEEPATPTTPATPATPPAPTEAPADPPPAPGASVFPDPPPAPVAAVEPPPEAVPVAAVAPPMPPNVIASAARPVQTMSFRPPPAPADLATPEPPPERVAMVSEQPYTPPAGPTASFAARVEPYLPYEQPPSPLNARAAALAGQAPLPPEPEPDVPQAAPEPAPAPQAAAAPQAIPFEGPLPDTREAARLLALSGIETGGKRFPYQALGAVTKTGDQAHGKYQVMGDNIPAWSRQTLGYPLTKEEFLQHPNAQDIMVRQKMAEYRRKYGEEGSGRAWYAGEEGMKNLAATDLHGRLTVGGYGRDYMNRIAANTGEAWPGGSEQGPVMASRGGTGRGTSGGVPQAPGLDQRDIIAAALMEQPQPPPGGVQQAQASPEDIQSEALLRESMGMRRPGSPFKATAARGDIQSDAPLPGLSPLGSATGAAIGDSVQQRQRIYDAVQQQQQAPVVPPADPTLAATTSPPSTPTGTGSDPVRLAQAMQQGIRPDMAPQWYQPPPPAAAPPPPAPATVTDIKPAPDMPPSREAIPAASDEAPIVVPPERKRPPLLAPNEREQHWLNVARDPRANEQTKLYATEMAARHAKWREQQQTIQQEEYKNYREKREQLLDARNKQVREGPDRQLKQQAARTDLEIKQAQAAVAPLEAKVKEADLALKQAQVSAIPNEVMKAELALKQAQATLEETQQRVNMGRAPPREKIGDQLLERQPDGTWKDVTPGTLIGNIKLTEQQARGIKFFERAQLVRKQGGDFAAMAGLRDSGTGKIPIAGNYWVSPEYQRQNSAADAWIESVLRDISGNAIKDDEYPTQKRIYFPQPGDSPQVMRDKEARRANQERSLYDSLGTAKPIADKYVSDEKAKEDKAALDWARSNPDDPRAVEILKRRGAR